MVRIRLYILLMIYSAGLYSCSEDNVVNSDVFVPQIENFWFNTADSSHTFQFTTSDNDQNVTRGIYFGSEENPDPQKGQSDLAGFFDNKYLEFNVRRPAGEIKFKGNFITNDRIELSSIEGNIVIVRQ